MKPRVTQLSVSDALAASAHNLSEAQWLALSDPERADRRLRILHGPRNPW